MSFLSKHPFLNKNKIEIFWALMGILYFLLPNTISSAQASNCEGGAGGGQKAAYCGAAEGNGQAKAVNTSLGVTWAAVAGTCTVACGSAIEGEIAGTADACRWGNFGAGTADQAGNVLVQKDMQSVQGAAMAAPGTAMGAANLMDSGKEAAKKGAKEGAKKGAKEGGKQAGKKVSTKQKIAICATAATSAAQTTTKIMSAQQNAKDEQTANDQANALSSGNEDALAALKNKSSLKKVLGKIQGINSNLPKDGCRKSRKAGQSVEFLMCVRQADSALAQMLDNPKKIKDFLDDFKKSSGQDFGSFIQNKELDNMSPGSLIAEASANGPINHDFLQAGIDAAASEYAQTKKTTPTELSESSGGYSGGGGGRHTASNAFGKDLKSMMKGFMGQLSPKSKKGNFHAKEIRFPWGNKNPQEMMKKRDISLFIRAHFQYLLAQKKGKVERLPWSTRYNQISSQVRKKR